MTKDTFTGTGTQQLTKGQKLEKLRGGLSSALEQASGIQQQLLGLGTGPKVSGALSNLLSEKAANEQRVRTSLELAGKLGGAFSVQGRNIKSRVAAGQFVAGTSSRISTKGGVTRSTFQVRFGALTKGLDQLIKRQKGVDLQVFQAQKAALQSQFQIAQTGVGLAQQQIDLFEKANRSAKALLTKDFDAVARLRKKRGRLSLRTKGSRASFLEDTETTTGLLS